MNNVLMFSSENQAWSTPLDYYNKLDLKYNFTLDPCASHDDHRCERYYTKESNGLKHSWKNETVFMNPPYGKEASVWVRKAYVASLQCVVVGLLIPRTDTAWWHDFIYDRIREDYYPGVKVKFEKGRLTFGSDTYWEWIWEQPYLLKKDGTKKANSLYKKYGKKNPAPFPSVTVEFDRRFLI